MALIDRVKWDEAGVGTVVWKFACEHGDALTAGSQVIVNEAQEALFVKGGAALDVLGPGTHTLATANIPLLRKLVNLPFGGRSPFTAEIWYVSKTVKRGLKWGTPSPIPLIDPMYNYPISVRAFGQWGFRISDTRSFVTQLVGSQVVATGKDVEDIFTGEINQRLADALSRYFTETRQSIFEVNARLNELSRFVQESLRATFDQYGVAIEHFNTERISIPDEERKQIQGVMQKRMEVDQLSQARISPAYAAIKQLDILQDAAQNPGAAGAMLSSGLGLGLGLGAGVQAGQALGQGLVGAASQPPAAPASAPSTDSTMTRLKQLKELHDTGLISTEDFERRKASILDAL